MKIRIEIDDGLVEDEVVIRCRRVDETVNRIHQFVLEQTAGGPRLVFYKDNREFYFPLDQVLFFETEGEQVYAHTKNDAFRIKHRLYELEEMLPHHFVRAAKATIVNIRQIYAITRNLTGASLVQFADTHKQVYASRHYFSVLKQRMNDRKEESKP